MGNTVLNMPEFQQNDILIQKVRSSFPVFAQHPELSYLDSAATAQKPQCVIETVSNHYSSECANINRGTYDLSVKATEKFEAVREKIAKFINAESEKNIVLTKGTTDAINLISQSFVRPQINEGDEIIISKMEHHANIIPWQLLAEQTGAKIKALEVNSNGQIDLNELEDLISDQTRIISLTHVSNVLGTVNPVKEITDIAHRKGIPVIIDGAQGITHTEVDIQDLNADFYVFSGHKLYGPTATGVLYGKSEYLKKMLPYQGGGDMILTVDIESSTFKPAPYKFEAGTPNIAGIIGLGAAIDYLESIDRTQIFRHEQSLLEYMVEEIAKVPGYSIICPENNKRSGVVSFIHDKAHPHDIGTILGTGEVAIRTGHHCAQPLMKHLGLVSTARASIGIYNNISDIHKLITALHKVNEVFKR